MRGFSVSSPSITCKHDIVRVDYNIMSHWLHVPIIVRWQSDGCSLSSKNCAVIWESLRQAVASLTILDLVVGDHCCTHSLFYLGSVCIDFIMWSLSDTILIEFDLGFLSGNFCFLLQWGCVLSGHIHVFPVVSLVSLRGKSIQHCSPQMPWLSLPWDQQDALGAGTCLLAHLACEHTDLWWFGRIRARHDVPDFQCRHLFLDSNSWTVLADVLSKELNWSQHTNWRLGWCRMLQMPVLIQCCGCCPVVAGWCSMLCHTQHNHSPAWSE